MIRKPALVSVCLLALVAGTAPAKPKQPPAPARAYIETSYLVAPKTADVFQLTRSKYEPAAKAAGAGFHYAMTTHPELVIDVFVYPAGRRDPATALAEGLAAFRRDMASAVTKGTYARLDELTHAPFVLGGEAAPAPANGLDAAVQAAIAESERTPGEKLQLDLRLQSGMRLFSNGYLFYKQLYYFKVRVSAAQDAIAQDSFDTLADQAARTLVPAIQVANVGGCADAAIHLDVNDTPEHNAVELVRQARLQMGFNCHASAKDAGIDQAADTVDVVEITYSADDWASR